MPILGQTEKIIPLLTNYLRELQKIAGKPALSDEQLAEEALTLLDAPMFDWTPIYGTTPNKMIGFVCLSVAPVSDHIGYFCGEAYIIPSERRKGYMRQKIKELIQNKKISELSFAVQMKNKVAKDFWTNCLHDLGFIESPHRLKIPIFGDMDICCWKQRQKPTINTT